MDKELINRAWASLPAEFRKEVREYYNKLLVQIGVPSKDPRDAYEAKDARSQKLALENVFGLHNLTSDAEPQEEDTATEQRKFRKGDIVKWHGMPYIYIVEECFDSYKIRNTNGLSYTFARGASLFPYTAPTDKAEEKELDLSQILKGYENKKVYSPCFGTISMVKGNNRLYPNSIAFSLNHTSGLVYFKSNGLEYHSFEDGVCSIFPNKELYKQYPLDAKRAWQVWEEQQSYLLYVSIWKPENNQVRSQKFGEDEFLFRTKEDAEYAVQEVKKCLERVNNELNNRNV